MHFTQEVNDNEIFKVLSTNLCFLA